MTAQVFFFNVFHEKDLHLNAIEMLAGVCVTLHLSIATSKNPSMVSTYIYIDR